MEISEKISLRSDSSSLCSIEFRITLVASLTKALFLYEARSVSAFSMMLLITSLIVFSMVSVINLPIIGNCSIIFNSEFFPRPSEIRFST